MNPVETFDGICHAILKNYDTDSVITIGILVVDEKRQNNVKPYILEYMDNFDKKSGEYIDFYIPGYHRENNNAEREQSFDLDRNQSSYYFDKWLFDEFIEKMQDSMNIKYNGNPMLILAEVKQRKKDEKIKFKKILVIDLDGDSEMGVERTKLLFDKIFEIAKKHTELRPFQSGVRIHYIKGKAVKNIKNILKGDWIEAVENVIEDIYHYRLISGK